MDREYLLGRQKIEIPSQAAGGATIRVSAKGRAGNHRVVLTVRANSRLERVEQPIKILVGSTHSTGRLGGAWVDIYQHDEAEGKPFNADLGRLTDVQWRELVRAMHATEQDIVVITMMFQHFTHRGRHKIETEGYPGRAYYPSKLFPGRMTITVPDPLEIIMSEQPPKPASFSESLRPKAAKILQPIGRTLIRLHITANMITFFGFLLAAVSGLLAATRSAPSSGCATTRRRSAATRPT